MAQQLENQDNAEKVDSSESELSKLKKQYAGIVDKQTDIWSEKDRTAMKQWLDTVTSTDKAKQALKDLPTFIDAGKAKKNEHMKKYSSQELSDPWTISEKERQAYEQKVAAMTFEERWAFFESGKYEEYRQAGIAQSVEFRSDLDKAEKEGLLAQVDRRAFTAAYLDAPYEKRKEISAQLRAFVSHHKDSVRNVFAKLDAEDPKLFTRRAIHQLKAQMLSASADDRRKYMKGYDAILGALRKERLEKEGQYMRKIDVLHAENGIGRSEADALKGEFQSAPAEERSRLDHAFDQNAQLGRKNRDEFYEAVERSGLTIEEQNAERIAFANEEWDQRLSRLKRLQMQAALDGVADNSTEEKKDFEEVLKTVAEAQSAQLNEFRAVQNVVDAGPVDHVDVPTATGIHTLIQEEPESSENAFHDTATDVARQREEMSKDKARVQVEKSGAAFVYNEMFGKVERQDMLGRVGQSTWRKLFGVLTTEKGSSGDAIVQEYRDMLKRKEISDEQEQILDNLGKAA